MCLNRTCLTSFVKPPHTANCIVLKARKNLLILAYTFNVKYELIYLHDFVMFLICRLEIFFLTILNKARYPLIFTEPDYQHLLLLGVTVSDQFIRVKTQHFENHSTETIQIIIYQLTFILAFIQNCLSNIFLFLR